LGKDPGTQPVGRDVAGDTAPPGGLLTGHRGDRGLLRTGPGALGGAGLEHRVGMQSAQSLQRGEAPDLFQPGRDRVGGKVVRRLGVQVAGDPVTGLQRRGNRRLLVGRDGHLFLRACGWWTVRDGWAQRTAPAICSSMRRLSSRAYSIGSSLAIGSTKPRTIIAIASSSAMPRDIR